MNLYGFAGNNPVRFFDRNGLDYGDWWDARTWFNSGFVEGYQEAAVRQWGQIEGTAAGVGQVIGTVSIDYGRQQIAASIARFGPILKRLQEDPCFRLQVKQLLGDAFAQKLASLQTAEGIGALLGGIGTEALFTAGTAGIGKLKWLDDLEALASKLPPGRIAAKEGASVGSGMGGELLPATRVRTIQKGERISDLEAELTQRTYTSGGLEHAIISLNSGERVIVSGGSGGIQFGSDLRRVIGHTHPSTTGPSAADFQMLRDTGQRHSYIYELFGGGRSRFNAKE